jgi:hypothetical protein
VHTEHTSLTRPSALVHAWRDKLITPGGNLVEVCKVCELQEPRYDFARMFRTTSHAASLPKTQNPSTAKLMVEQPNASENCAQPKLPPAPVLQTASVTSRHPNCPPAWPASSLACAVCRHCPPGPCCLVARRRSEVAHRPERRHAPTMDVANAATALERLGTVSSQGRPLPSRTFKVTRPHKLQRTRGTDIPNALKGQRVHGPRVRATLLAWPPQLRAR